MRERASSEKRDRINAVEREAKDLRRASETLTLGSAFSSDGARPPAQVFKGLGGHRTTLPNGQLLSIPKSQRQSDIARQGNLTMRGADPLNKTLFTTRRPDDFVPDNHPPAPRAQDGELGIEEHRVTSLWRVRH